MEFFQYTQAEWNAIQSGLASSIDRHTCNNGCLCEDNLDRFGHKGPYYQRTFESNKEIADRLKPFLDVLGNPEKLDKDIRRHLRLP